MTVKLFVVVAVLTIVGTRLAMVLGRILKERFVSPPPRDSDLPVAIPHPLVFGVERQARPIIRVLFYIFIAVALLIKPLKTQWSDQVFNVVGVAWFCCTVLLSCYALLVAVFFRCVSCDRRFLLESLDHPPFPSPRKQGAAIRDGSFQCMFCGQRYTIK
jgi:hypothetical protein